MRPRRQAGSHGRSQVRPRMPGKTFEFPVDRPRLAVAAGGDQPDVFGHRRMRRARPLAIDNLMEVVGISDVGGLQQLSPARPSPRQPGLSPGAIARLRPCVEDAAQRHSGRLYPYRPWPSSSFAYPSEARGICRHAGNRATPPTAWLRRIAYMGTARRRARKRAAPTPTIPVRCATFGITSSASSRIESRQASGFSL